MTYTPQVHFPAAGISRTDVHVYLKQFEYYRKRCLDSQIFWKASGSSATFTHAHMPMGMHVKLHFLLLTSQS